MLVLSRKIGERIVVPDCELVITVLGMEGKTVRLGISAPAAVNVFRKEDDPPAQSETDRFRSLLERSDP